MKASVPPTSLTTSISWCRFWISRRTVLPTISSTAADSRLVSTRMPRSRVWVIASRRRTHCRSTRTMSISRYCLSVSASCSVAGAELARREGLTRMTAGRGLLSSRSRASPKPERRRNSASACSRVIRRASATSSRRAMMSRTCPAWASSRDSCRNREILDAPSQFAVRLRTLSMSRCSPLGRAMAMPMTAAVIRVLSGCWVRRPSEESDIWACRNSHTTGLRLRRKPRFFLPLRRGSTLKPGPRCRGRSGRRATG